MKLVIEMLKMNRDFIIKVFVTLTAILLVFSMPSLDFFAVLVRAGFMGLIPVFASAIIVDEKNIYKKLRILPKSYDYIYYSILSWYMILLFAGILLHYSLTYFIIIHYNNSVIIEASDSIFSFKIYFFVVIAVVLNLILPKISFKPKPNMSRAAYRILVITGLIATIFIWLYLSIALWKILFGYKLSNELFDIPFWVLSLMWIYLGKIISRK